jgi:hypothetical protein
MGDRVGLETATPPVLGKEISDEVSLASVRSLRSLSGAGKRKGVMGQHENKDPLATYATCTVQTEHRHLSTQKERKIHNE